MLRKIKAPIFNSSSSDECATETVYHGIVNSTELSSLDISSCMSERKESEDLFNGDESSHECVTPTDSSIFISESDSLDSSCNVSKKKKEYEDLFNYSELDDESIASIATLKSSEDSCFDEEESDENESSSESDEEKISSEFDEDKDRCESYEDKSLSESICDEGESLTASVKKQRQSGSQKVGNNFTVEGPVINLNQKEAGQDVLGSTYVIIPETANDAKLSVKSLQVDNGLLKNHELGVDEFDVKIKNDGTEAPIKDNKRSSKSPQLPTEALKALSISDSPNSSGRKSTQRQSRFHARTTQQVFDSPYNTRLKARLLRELNLQSPSEGRFDR